MDPLTFLSTSFLTSAISNLTNKLLDSSWPNDIDTVDATDIIRQFSNNDIAFKYSKEYASKNLKMRTLHRRREDVYLDEIYVPLRIKNNNNNNNSILVSDNCTINSDKIVNIIGIAGQGKSTILRKLFLEEINKGERFPFFIELRNLNNSSIYEYLLDILKNLGISPKSESLNNLLRSKKIILLLDGFDEVEPSKRLKVVKEISEMKSNYNCNIITSSRPDTQLCNYVDILNYDVQPLVISDIKNIINKLGDNDKDLEKLIISIENSKNIQSVLISPILVNLYYISYPYLDSEPKNIADFYERLFLTLYLGHDKTKCFERKKHSDLNEHEIKKVFDTFCFMSLTENEYEFSSSTIYSYISKALKINNLETKNIRGIKEDIINITCLIQEDAYEKYVFLHKSIQEYHAANFVASLNNKVKTNFYKIMREKYQTSDQYDNVISFLSITDESNYNSMFLLELFSSLNDYDIDSEDYKAVLDDIIPNSISFIYAEDEIEKAKIINYIPYGVIGILLLLSKVDEDSKLKIFALNSYLNMNVHSLIKNNDFNLQVLKELEPLYVSNEYRDRLITLEDGTVNQIKTNYKTVSYSYCDFMKYIGEFEMINKYLNSILKNFINKKYLPIKNTMNNQSLTIQNLFSSL